MASEDLIKLGTGYNPLELGEETKGELLNLSFAIWLTLGLVILILIITIIFRKRLI
jgi:glucan phosphoethanolaminetransferase (alkaline phosphatase superfamily)